MSRRPGKGKKEKPFASIEVATVTSDPWKQLNRTESHVYNILKTFYHGNREGFKASFGEQKNRSRIRHGKTLDSAIQGLEQKAWLKVVRYAKHGQRRGLRVRPNEYELTFQFDFCRW